MTILNTGIVFICGKIARALYDAGASDAFVSLNFVKNVGDLPHHTGVERKIRLADGTVIFSSVVYDLEAIIEGKLFEVPATEVRMAGYDLILGMSWLHRNHALIDWQTKTLTLKHGDSEVVVGTTLTSRLPLSTTPITSTSGIGDDVITDNTIT